MSWKMDPAHSQITFSIRHMMISTVRGRFENFDVTVEGDEDHPERAELDVKIEVASINTREPKRDGHLRSADFFDAEKYPYITYKSKRIEMTDDHHGRVYGDLTIRDITREVVLDVEYAGQSKSPYGTVAAGFDGKAKINRKDWNLTWNVALETGGWLVGDDVQIDIELELVKQP